MALCRAAGGEDLSETFVDESLDLVEAGIDDTLCFSFTQQVGFHIGTDYFTGGLDGNGHTDLYAGLRIARAWSAFLALALASSSVSTDLLIFLPKKISTDSAAYPSIFTCSGCLLGWSTFFSGLTLGQTRRRSLSNHPLFPACLEVSGRTEQGRLQNPQIVLFHWYPFLGVSHAVLVTQSNTEKRRDDCKRFCRRSGIFNIASYHEKPSRGCLMVFTCFPVTS